MAVKTQGTELYFIDPYDNSVNKVGCPTSISGINATRDQIDVTCLDSEARVYLAGMAAPGNATFGINIDPSDASHIRLHELYKTGDKFNWALGLSDGTSAPTADSDGEVIVGAARSWIDFNGYISDYPFDLALNSVVQSTVSIQVSDFPNFTPKA